MRKNTGMEEPCTRVPKLLKIIRSQTYCKGEELEKGRFCSFSSPPSAMSSTPPLSLPPPLPLPPPLQQLTLL
ncbi:hypothetical protein FF1_047075 [Malus domestica]